jgi:hypothetical protein
LHCLREVRNRERALGVVQRRGLRDSGDILDVLEAGEVFEVEAHLWLLLEEKQSRMDVGLCMSSGEIDQNHGARPKRSVRPSIWERTAFRSRRLKGTQYRDFVLLPSKIVLLDPLLGATLGLQRWPTPFGPPTDLMPGHLHTSHPRVRTRNSQCNSFESWTSR